MFPASSPIHLVPLTSHYLGECVKTLKITLFPASRLAHAPELDQRQNSSISRGSPISGRPALSWDVTVARNLARG